MVRVLCAAVAALVATAPALAATPAPPPTIYHVITRPLCSELHEHIAPAIGMMLQNDATIKKSPDLFSQYNTSALYGHDAGTAGISSNGSQSGGSTSGDPAAGTLNASQNMALLGLENLIRPLANNIIAIQKLLDTPALLHGTGLPDDDKQLQAIRAQLLKALATQNASLDIISGFVDTQQMADLQHAGEEYISNIAQPDVKTGGGGTPPPDPLTSNPNYAGLPPNPYSIDLANVPGLTLGYNPVTRLLDALHWTIGQTSDRENTAAKAVMSSAALCHSIPAASPSP